MDSLLIMTLNCHGLGDREKPNDELNYLNVNILTFTVFKIHILLGIWNLICNPSVV